MQALDAIDRKILSLLQSDSRMTMQELADKVGLSVSPCHRRVKLLEARGVQWQQLGMVRDTGEWKFSCAIASPHNASVSHTYEGRAKTSLAAMQAVLDQIDKDAAPAGP